MTRGRRRRAYFRRYKRLCRAAALAARQQGRVTCPARIGAAECGGLLEDRVTRDGTVTVCCARCTRRERGICQACPRPVAGKVPYAKWCAGCKRQAARDQTSRYRTRHGEAIRRRDRNRRRQQRVVVAAGRNACG